MRVPQLSASFWTADTNKKIDACQDWYILVVNDANNKFLKY